MAVEIGELQNPLAIVAADVEVPLQDDAVLSERSRFVGAKHVHRAEILDRVQPFDDDLLLRHGHGAFGEVHGHDHGKHFGRQSDRNRHREEEGFEPLAFGEAVDQKNGRNHDQNEAYHQPGEAVDALVEACKYARSGEGAGKLAKICSGAGMYDHARRISAHDARPHEAQVLAFERIGRFTFGRFGTLFDGERLAGKRCLVQKQIFLVQQQQVAWNHVARR